MARLDTSIPLGVRQVKLEQPQDIRMRALALQGAEREAASAQRAETERRTIADLYRTSGGDAAKLETGLADAGLGDRIPALRKQQAELGKLQNESESSKLKLAKDRLDMVNGALSSVLANPQATQSDVIGALNYLVQNGVYTAEQGAQMARNIPPGDALRPWLTQLALQSADAGKRLDALMPKYDEQDRGGTINEGTLNPLTGQRTAGREIQKTNTPGELLNSQNVQAAIGAGVTYQTDANGNIIALPSKPGAGGITPRPVTNPDGSPTSGRGLNDAQSKALLFGSRARDSAQVMQQLEQSGTLTPSIAKQYAEKIPLVGGLAGMAANATTASPDEQKLEQAQRDFVNAVLRRESGAVISKEEFDNAAKQYFPSIGDSPEVIAQKAANRQLAIDGLLAEVPEGKRNSIGTSAAPPAAPTRARPPLSTFEVKR